MSGPAPRTGVDLLILAGGASRRMGRDKPSIHFPGPGDPPLLHRVAGALRPLVDSTLIAGPTALGLEARLVPDDPGYPGPLGGLLAGLEAAGLGGLVLVVAADLVRPSPELAGHLLELARGAPDRQAVVPEREGRLEPLFAVYRTAAAGVLREALPRDEARGTSLRRALASLRVRVVREWEWRPLDGDGESFLNCNTPEELAAAAGRG